MAILSKAALLGATTAPTQVVQIPELGGDVLVRGMTARQRTAFEKKFVSESKGRIKRNFDAFREQIVVFCCVDPKFDEEDVERLSAVRADVLERIANVALQLSGITEKDIEALGEASGPKTVSTTSSSVSPEN